MTISQAIIAVLAFLLLLTAGIRWRRWLAAAWIFTVLVLPLIRFHIGAPIYVMDVMTVLFLSQMIRRGDRFLPFKLLPWPWIFIGVAFVSTLTSGLLLFGFHLEQPWIWGHYSLTCLPLVFAPAVRLETDGYYTKPLTFGITVSLLALAAIGMIQYFDLPGNEQLRDLFYGDFESATKDVGQAVERMWQNKTTDVLRTPGPHFSPGAFGGTTLLGFLALVILQRGNYTLSTYLGALSAAIVTLTSVTRLVVVAGAIGLTVLFAVGSRKERLRAILFFSVAVVAGATFLGTYFSHSWSERFARWDHGIMEDDNVQARGIDGPLRLVNFFKLHPQALGFGAGLDPEKLMARTDQDSNFESGFVSNSFLLSLYCMGVLGFVCYTWFWWAVLRSSLIAPRPLRGAFSGTAVVCGIIIAADNYAMMFEAAATVLNLIAGLILSESIFNRTEALITEESADCEKLEEAHAA